MRKKQDGCVMRAIHTVTVSRVCVGTAHNVVDILGEPLGAVVIGRLGDYQLRRLCGEQYVVLI